MLNTIVTTTEEIIASSEAVNSGSSESWIEITILLSILGLFIIASFFGLKPKRKTRYHEEEEE